MPLPSPQQRDLSSPDLRQRLRSDTRLIHEETERAFGVLDMARPEALAVVLRAHGGALRAFADLFSRADETVYAETADRLCRHIDHDLAALGEIPLGGYADLAPSGYPLGYAYVMVGSRMGSRQIAKSLEDIGAVRGALHYFADAEPAKLWPQLCARLSALPTSHHDGVILSAERGFARFRDGLANNLTAYSIT